MADGAVPGDAALDVATDAPAHRKGLVNLFDHGHLLNITVAGRAVDLSRNVPHMREVDVVRYFVNANPGDRLLIFRVIHELLDLGLLPFIGSTDHLVATHTRRNRRDPRIDRPLRREVAVLAVDLIHAGMDGMGKRDRLVRIGVFGDDSRATFLRL